MKDVLILLAAFSATLTVTGLVFFKAIWSRPVRRALGLHVWRYRNPFDRTCEDCQRHEVFHGWSYTPLHQGWWETFNEGSGRRVLCCRAEPSAIEGN